MPVSSSNFEPDFQRPVFEADTGSMQSVTLDQDGNEMKQTTSWDRLGFIALVAFGFAAVAVFLVAAPTQVAPDNSPAVGLAGPDLDLVRLPEVASAQLPESGKVTLLHLWGTWCPPCRMEFPELAEMANRHAQADDFQFVPVSCEGGAGETFQSLWRKTSEYYDSNDIDSVVYADPSGRTRDSLVQRLNKNDLFFPTSVVIDQQGNIVGVWEGYTETAVGEISDLLDDLLQ